MKSPSVAGSKVLKSACALCPCCCGIVLHVKDGKLVKVKGMPEHPLSRGRLCPKGASIIDYVYSPDRIQYPMKREGKEWKRISWPEALDTIANKLLKIKETYGARSLAICKGLTGWMGAWGNVQLLHRFADVYGTPNIFSGDNGCFRTSIIARGVTLGAPAALVDVERSQCIMLWGHNPHASVPYQAWWDIPIARKNGAKLIAIDPRRIPFAREADIHAQPRPGSDGALALGLINVIISEGLYDKEFVDKWTVGFDKLIDHVKPFTPDEVEKITWVPAQTVMDIARMFATTKPACIVQGFNTLDMKTDGLNSSRSIAILQAITGNFMVPGGFKSCPLFIERSLRLLDKVDEEPLGSDTYPLWWEGFFRLHGEGQATTALDAMLTEKPYPIKAMIVTGANPLRSWPNTTKVEKAMEKLDFLAVMDPFMTQTAERADIVLPAATFVEKTELCQVHWNLNGIPYVQMRPKAIEVGECWSDGRFWLEMAKRMGYEEYFPWRDEFEVYNYLMEPMGVTVQDLLDKPDGFFYGEPEYKIDEQKGLWTPSGKVEIFSEFLAKRGYDPLPRYQEPPESPISTPELAQEYPLILTTGARVREYMHSQLRGIRRLHRLRPEATAEMHRETAAKYGISDQNTVEVQTKRGAIHIKASVTEDIVPGVVNISHGWHEANVNILTDDAPADPFLGNPPLKAALCRVTKV